MTGWFNKLPGFQKTPAGVERVILRKLKLSSRVQAAVFAVNHGLDQIG